MSLRIDGNTLDLLALNPARILIVRLSAIGDTVAAMPVLNALRMRYPTAEIAWLVEDRSAALLYGHPALDRVFIAKKGWLKSFDEVRLLRKRLQAFSPNITIDVQCLFKSAFAAWLSGAKTRIGFGGNDGREGSRWLNNVRVHADETHIIDKNMQLLHPIGICGSSVEFDLPESEADRVTAARIRHEMNAEGSFAVLNIGASWASKRWEINRFTDLAVYLSEQWNIPSLLIGGSPEERNDAEKIVVGSRGIAQLTPMLSLTELAALCRESTIFIGSDTGPLHIAAAVGTPCIGLFGPTKGLRTGPYGPIHRIVQKRTPIEPNFKPREASSEWMDAIALEHVSAACDEILTKISSESVETVPFPNGEKRNFRVSA